MIDRNALEFLADQACDAADLAIVHNSEQQTIYIDSEGVSFTVKKPSPDRKHQALSLNSLVDAMQEFSSDTASIWVSTKEIVGLCNHSEDSHRRDRVSMSLSPHHAFPILQNFNWMSQKQMISLLRESLTDCTFDQASFKDSIKSLKFDRSENSHSNIQATSVSMGRSINAKLTGEIDLPETVTVEFHPYPALAEEVDVSVAVTCSLIADPEEGKLKLIPHAGQIDEAYRKALVAVGDKVRELAGESIKVFLGTP